MDLDNYGYDMLNKCHHKTLGLFGFMASEKFKDNQVYINDLFSLV